MAVFSRGTFLAVVQIDTSKEQHLAFRIFLLEPSRDSVSGIGYKTIFFSLIQTETEVGLEFFLQPPTPCGMNSCHLLVPGSRNSGQMSPSHPF